jgi:hypothetical protein
MPPPQMPLPILLPRKTPSTFYRILTPLNCTKILLRRLMYVVDMAVDVFGGFEAPGAIGTRGGVEMGFEVAAEG